MARITSAYQNTGYTAPRLVKRWEEQAEQSETDSGAQLQLTYHMLLQLRAIKLLLLGVLVIVPIAAVVLMVVLSGASEPESSF